MVQAERSRDGRNRSISNGFGDDLVGCQPEEHDGRTAKDADITGTGVCGCLQCAWIRLERPSGFIERDYRMLVQHFQQFVEEAALAGGAADSLISDDLLNQVT